MEKRRATSSMTTYYPPQGNTDEITFCQGVLQSLLELLISYAAILLMDSGTLPVIKILSPYSVAVPSLM